jgi:hypothetical protein
MINQFYEEMMTTRYDWTSDDEMMIKYHDEESGKRHETQRTNVVSTIAHRNKQR